MSGLPLEQQRPTWAEVDLDALAHNLRCVRGRLGDIGVLAIVKADAYGHGAVPVARRLAREGVGWLGVALPEEGVEIRRAGIPTPILVQSGFVPAQADLILEHGLTPAVFRREQVDALAAAAARRGATAGVHVKVDTGMGRLGVPMTELAGLAAALASAPSIRVTGAFSHLAVADQPDDPFTAQQLQTFLRAVNVLRDHGLRPGLLHLANSPAVLHHRATWLSLTRPGLLLYGYNPDPRGPTMPVRPVLTLKSRVVDVRDLAPGGSVGYGRTWRAVGTARIATLPIGYADGLPRAASSRGEVLLRGRRVPIVGRINMDLTTIDVTSVPDAAPGDVAIVFGRQGRDTLGADALATAAGTIVWEILSRIGPRVPRLVIEDGRPATTPASTMGLERPGPGALS